jgi:hypothetical protein
MTDERSSGNTELLSRAEAGERGAVLEKVHNSKVHNANCSWELSLIATLHAAVDWANALERAASAQRKYRAAAAGGSPDARNLHNDWLVAEVHADTLAATMREKGYVDE